MYKIIEPWDMNSHYSQPNSFTPVVDQWHKHTRDVAMDFELLRVRVNSLGETLNGLQVWIEGFAKWVDQQHPGTLQDYATHLAVTQRIMDAIRD